MQNKIKTKRKFDCNNISESKSFKGTCTSLHQDLYFLRHYIERHKMTIFMFCHIVCINLRYMVEYHDISVVKVSGF